MTLETTRLRLRPFREDDVQAIYDNSAAPEVGLNAGWKPHESLTESYDVLHLMFLDQPTVWAIERRGDGRLMGSIGLIADSARQYGSVRSVGYSLGTAYWGRGYMTEALRAVTEYGFERMSLDLISATCYARAVCSKSAVLRMRAGCTVRSCCGTARCATICFFICRTKPCRQMQNKTYIFLRNVL